MNSAARSTIIAAGLLGLTGVALGASGAHGQLHDALVAAGTLDTWRTAVLYHLIHAVALLALGAWTVGWPAARWIARGWIAGVVLFSGSLYWLALGGPKFVGPVTPLGGLAFLAGWLLLAWTAYRLPKT